ncbi:hypothetical protein PROFUN_01931 [Planoprotostelium fungivorum]|uniref:VWFA domain-containing protein n=1 Tax=Planoprotostelium fungivorum TaxID=1890364 RepID=A0A2P6NZ27_9EUKA|nr:hypothetical protein PROFUN_01931 [Planoprotostelium fungivorum]
MFNPILDGVICFVFLIVASWCVGEGGEILGKKYDASVIGGIVIAWLNTAPETIFFITALQSGNARFAVGAVSGSTVVVSTVAVGACLWIGSTAKKTNISLQPAVKSQCYVLLLSTGISFIIAITGFTIVMGFAGVIFYLWFMWKSLQKSPEDPKEHDEELGHAEEEEEEEEPVSKGFIYLVIGGLLIVFFSSPFINSVVATAELLSVNPILLAFFLAPIASEAPEILESISLSRKGNLQSINIAYSNLIGGTILCFFGVAKELTWEYPSFTFSLLMMIFCAGMAAGIGYFLPSQNKWHGAGLLGSFVVVGLIQYFANSSRRMDTLAVMNTITIVPSVTVTIESSSRRGGRQLVPRVLVNLKSQYSSTHFTFEQAMPRRPSYKSMILGIIKSEPERALFSHVYLKKKIVEEHTLITENNLKRYTKLALDKLVADGTLAQRAQSYKMRKAKPKKKAKKPSPKARSPKSASGTARKPRAPKSSIRSIDALPPTGDFSDRQPQSTGPDSGMTELIFAFDTTGSMAGAIAEVKTKITHTIDRLFRDTPLIRIGLIAHGDYCDGPVNALRLQDFVQMGDSSKLTEWVNTVTSTGGGDGDENYEMVLEHAHDKFSWTEGSRRVLVMIGDASPHAPAECLRQMKEFNIPDPRAIDWIKETDACWKKGIKIYSVGVNCSLPFHREIAERTCGTHFTMQGFEGVTDMILALCFREHSGGSHYGQFLKEVQAEGRMTSNMQRLVKQLSTTIAPETAATCS